MKNIQKIAFIGATGRLGLPIAQEMLAAGYAVKALCRNPFLAKARLPECIETVSVDLEDVKSIAKNLKDCEAVYINLATETLQKNQNFYVEREGIRNIVEAAQLTGIRQILKIGALGSYPYANHLKTYFFPNEIKRQGHHFIENSSIPFTIFHPSSFEESLLFAQKGNTIQWIGKPIEHYWTNIQTFSRLLVNAIDNPRAFGKHYAVQGKEKKTYWQVFEQFKLQNPALQLRISPLGLIKFLGLFNEKMKVLAALFEYFSQNPEKYYAENTWQDLALRSTLIRAD